MDTSTFDLYNVLQSGPYDEAGLSQIKRLLGGQRRLLRGNNDLQALDQLIPLLQDWAIAAGGGWLSASALAEAAEIAEIDLRNSARAEQLRSEAIMAGRTASGMPAPSPESVATEGAIDANAELLHELKTMPPGALTQTLLSDATEGLETIEELEVDVARESSIPHPRSMPAPPLRNDPDMLAVERSTSGAALRADVDGSSDSSFEALLGSTSTLRGDAEAPSDPSAPGRAGWTSTLRGDAEAPSDPSAPGRVGSTSKLRGDAEAPSDPSAPGRAGWTSTLRGNAQAPSDLSAPEGVDSEPTLLGNAEATGPRSIPAPALLGAADAQSDSSFPARLRSTPPPALRSVTEPRRPSSVPAQPRAGGGAAASQARRPSVPTQPIRLSPLPQLAASEQYASELQEHTQEVHTIDLELHPTLSVPPLQAAEPANDDALSTAIAQAEHALDSDASPERVRELAELYVTRDASGDRAQAADLYCTLGEVLGNPGGIASLDRALALVPDHVQAKALLTRYALRPRMPISSPKITVLGVQPKLSMPQPPPPAAAVGKPPLAAGAAQSGAFAPSASLAPLSAASTAQRPAPSLPPRASLAPRTVQADARGTLPGTGPMKDVLSLHGVPQVVTTRPSVPPISSLSPIVRSDASELNARRLSVAKSSYVALGGIALSAAAALGLYVSVRAPSNDTAPVARPAISSESTGPTAAASQPTAEANEPEPPSAASAIAGQARAGMPAPLAPPGPSHLPLLKLESAQLRGGKLSEPQLTAALGKAQPKLLACYEQAIEKKPRIKGRVIYGFTVRTNGRATNIKRVGGTLKDDALLQCSVKVLETVRFPKPRKRSSQVKLPIQYKRT